KTITDNRKPPLYHSPPAARDDVGEAPHFEAGAANQRPIHVGLGDELADVVGLHASAVNDVTMIGGVRAEPLSQAHPSMRGRLARLSGRGGTARSNRPHRLVRHHELSDLIGSQP